MVTGPETPLLLVGAPSGGRAPSHDTEVLLLVVTPGAGCPILSKLLAQGLLNPEARQGASFAHTSWGRGLVGGLPEPGRPPDVFRHLASGNLDDPAKKASLESLSSLDLPLALHHRFHALDPGEQARVERHVARRGPVYTTGRLLPDGRVGLVADVVVKLIAVFLDLVARNAVHGTLLVPRHLLPGVPLTAAEIADALLVLEAADHDAAIPGGLTDRWSTFGCVDDDGGVLVTACLRGTSRPITVQVVPVSSVDDAWRKIYEPPPAPTPTALRRRPAFLLPAVAFAAGVLVGVVAERLLLHGAEPVAVAAEPPLPPVEPALPVETPQEETLLDPPTPEAPDALVAPAALPVGGPTEAPPTDGGVLAGKAGPPIGRAEPGGGPPLGEGRQRRRTSGSAERPSGLVESEELFALLAADPSLPLPAGVLRSDAGLTYPSGDPLATGLGAAHARAACADRGGLAPAADPRGSSATAEYRQGSDGEVVLRWSNGEITPHDDLVGRFAVRCAR